MAKKTILLGIILATTALNFGGGIQTANADASRVTAAVQYHDQWRSLWEEHISWTRSVIMGVLDNLPCTSAYVDRLLQNPGDMAKALQPYYGDAVSAQFKHLVTEHLTIAVDVLNAAKAGDTAALNDAVARWYANANAIAGLMAQVNPTYWPLAEAKSMWKEHLDATLAEAVAHLSNDCTGEVAAYDKVHDLALEMADFFSNGIIRQFRGRFSHQGI